MIRFNQKFSTIRRNSITRKNTQIQFDEAMAIPILTYGSEILNITKKAQSKNLNCRDNIFKEYSWLHKEEPNKKC
jgi:hypothetical protein